LASRAVQRHSKVCAILRVLAQNSPLRLTESPGATSLNKATTLRILGSLIEGRLCQ
jgi:DNA-binding IclR family transcriptional regulator